MIPDQSELVVGGPVLLAHLPSDCTLCAKRVIRSGRVRQSSLHREVCERRVCAVVELVSATMEKGCNESRAGSYLDLS